MGKVVSIIAACAALALMVFGALGYWGAAGRRGPAPAILAASPAPEPSPRAAAAEALAQQAAAQTGDRKVDFDAAKAAHSGEVAAAQANGVDPNVAKVQSNPAAQTAKVPVLIPQGIVQTESAGPPTFKETAKGYYVRLRAPKYDVIVNGTSAYWKEDGKASGAAPKANDYKFEETDGGATLSFSRFGADYLIEFECHEANDDSQSCITKEEAIKMAENLGQIGK